MLASFHPGPHVTGNCWGRYQRLGSINCECFLEALKLGFLRPKRTPDAPLSTTSFLEWKRQIPRYWILWPNGGLCLFLERLRWSAKHISHISFPRAAISPSSATERGASALILEASETWQTERRIYWHDSANVENLTPQFVKHKRLLECKTAGLQLKPEWGRLCRVKTMQSNYKSNKKTKNCWHAKPLQPWTQYSLF